MRGMTLLVFFLVGCQSLSTMFDPKTWVEYPQPEPRPKPQPRAEPQPLPEIVEPDVPRDDPDYLIPDEELALKPVEGMHWSCCADLCKGFKRVASVLNEADTPYIRCNCSNGKQFRVTRTRIAHNAKRKALKRIKKRSGER